MLQRLNGLTEKQLSDLDRIQTSMQETQRQITSGTRVQKASDDPWLVTEILHSQSAIQFGLQIQANIGESQTELEAADSAVQQAIRLLDRARALAVQASRNAIREEERVAILQEARSLQEQLVGISRVAVNGRFIFSGGLDEAALYELDRTEPNGVRQLASATSIRQIQDVTGALVAVGKTAHDIFDPQDVAGLPLEGNSFAAIGQLIACLGANDRPGILEIVSSLEKAGDHLNEQLAFYGAVHNRLREANNVAAKFLLARRDELNKTRDADLAGAAIALRKAGVYYEAALSVKSKTVTLSVFDYFA